MEKIRVFEAFAGYGSQAMACEDLQENYPNELEFEFVGIAEIEPTAVKAYNAVHDETPNYGDISKIDWAQVPDFDLFTYSFPCQDISNAGKQKGLSEGSGTRSSLLWECRRTIAEKKPRYLLMENVKNLVSEKNMEDFKIWVQWLYDQGYQNFYQVMNAKDYGIPQNRERVFMISILDDSDDPFNRPSYVFPKPFKLKLRLKDLLETCVDESYYLQDDRVQKIVDDCDGDVAEGCGFLKDNTEGVIQVGNLIPDDGRKFTNPFIGRVYSPEGVSPTLLTMQGGSREPKVLLPMNTGKDGVCGCITAHYHKAGWADLNPKCQLPHPAVAELIPDPNAPLKIPQATKQGYVECPVGGVFDASYPTSKTRRGRVQENGEIAPTLTCNSEDAILRYEGMIPEPKILTPVRTEEAKRLRREGVEHFGNKQLVPREDGISNTITTVQKDNLLQEVDPIFLRFGFGHGKQGYSKDIAYTINSSAFEHNNFIVERPAEGAEYKGRVLKEGDAVDTSRSETFGTHIMEGVSPALRAERPEATAVCVKEGVEYKGKFIKEGDGLYTDTSQDFFRGGLEGVSRTLKAETHDAGCCVRDGYIHRIRKLTPRECFRLMGVDDWRIDKIQAAGICKTAQYKLAGNSIVKQCLYYILEELFIKKTKPIQASLF